jgi:hypothetical protein
MDGKNYREVISNPWSWFFAGEILYENANELHDLYVKRHEAILEYLKRRSNGIQENKCNRSTEPKNNVPSNTHIPPVFLMLIGMAIEDMAKGIIVARKLKANINIVDNATLKELDILGHCSPTLINKLGISITDTEKRLLKDANDHLIWAGRYAAPAKETHQISCDTIMHKTPGEIKEEMSLENLISLYHHLKIIYLKEAKDPLIEDWGRNHPYRVNR